MKQIIRLTLVLLLLILMVVAIGCTQQEAKQEVENKQVQNEMIGFNATAEIKDLKAEKVVEKISKNLEEGLLKRAAAISEEALKKEPKNVSLYLSLSAVYMYQAEYGNMVKTMRQAKVLAPKNPAVLNQLAWALIESGENVNEGVALAKESLTYFNGPDRAKQIPPYMDTYAYGLYKQGKYAEAIKYWENILPLTNSGEVYLHLGQAYEANDQKPRALEVYKRGIGTLELDIKDANILKFERERLLRLQKKAKDSLGKIKQG